LKRPGPFVKKCFIHLFNTKNTLFNLNCLKEFEGIVGLDFLKEVNAKINLVKNIIEFEGSIEALQFAEFKDVNFVKIDDKDVPMFIKNYFQKMIKLRSNAFADPNESLPYNSNTVATIPTDEEHIYSKMYPYPQRVSYFVNTEVQQLLADGIIRPSK